MDSKTLKLGILGTANIARRSIIPAVLELPSQFALEGIASREIEKATLLANDFNAKPFGSYDEIIESSLLDAVYIPLPNALHFKWVKKALEFDLHVLVEKSLGCNFKEVLELNDLAKEKSLVLVENFQFRFHQQLHYIQKIVNEGKIGELRSIRSSFGFPPFKDAGNIRYDPSLGGGALLDAGAYPVKILQHFMSGELEVAGAALFYDQNKGVDIGGGAFIRQKSGPLFGEIAFGFDHFYQCNVELWGSKGKVSANRIFTAPPGYSPEIVLETDSGIEKIVLDSDNHFKNMLIHFYNLCSGLKNKNDEYLQNKIQGKLIEDIKNKANG